MATSKTINAGTRRRGFPRASRISRTLAVVLTALAAGSLAACSPGDVQLEGKIFEAMGVAGNAQRSAAPQLKPRTPLVVPPSLERLPTPGQPAENQDAVLASINDPDLKKKQNKAQLEAEQAKVCAEVYEPAKARGDPDADLISGPLGPCRPSVLNLVGGSGSFFGTDKN